MPDQTTYAAIIGQILAQRRAALQLDQTMIAERVGVSQSTWSRIERGSSGLTVEQLAKVARVLQASPGELLIEADRARAGLEAQNVSVQDVRPEISAAGNGALLVGAVLGFLIARALAR